MARAETAGRIQRQQPTGLPRHFALTSVLACQLARALGQPAPAAGGALGAAQHAGPRLKGRGRRGMDDGGGAGPRQPTRQLGGRDGAAESGPALRLAASTAGAAVVQLTGLVMPAALGNRAGSSIAACKQLGLAGGGGSAARVVGGATVHGLPSPVLPRRAAGPSSAS